MPFERSLKILLTENPWDCDFGNEYLRQLLVDYSNFDDAVVCNPIVINNKQCFSSTDYEAKENVFIESRIYQIRVTVRSDEISVLIEATRQIWYRMISQNHITKVLLLVATVPRKKLFKLKDLDRGTVYTICLINIVEATVSPLDCISYYRYGAEFNGVWLIQRSKLLVIGAMVRSLLTSIIVSMMIGSIYFRSYHNTESIQKTFNPNLVDDSK